MGKKLILVALLILVVVVLLQIGFSFYQSESEKTKQNFTPEDRKIAVVSPSITPIQSSSLPLSQPKKSTITVRQVGKTLIWQDGMFLYRAASSTDKNVSPYAVIGVVTAIKDNTLEIVSAGKDFSFSDTITKVKLVLAEKNSNVSLLALKNGDMVSSKEITWNDIKKGDKVEGRSLKMISENYYSTSQIFVIK